MADKDTEALETEIAKLRAHIETLEENLNVEKERAAKAGTAMKDNDKLKARLEKMESDLADEKSYAASMQSKLYKIEKANEQSKVEDKPKKRQSTYDKLKEKWAKK